MDIFVYFVSRNRKNCEKGRVYPGNSTYMEEPVKRGTAASDRTSSFWRRRSMARPSVPAAAPPLAAQVCAEEEKTGPG